MSQGKDLLERLERKGLSRRDFMKYCSTLTATMGLTSAYVPKVAAALKNAPRPPVVWLAMAECTGCAEATLRTTYPWIDTLLLDIISLDYSETIMAPSGQAAEKSLQDTLAKNAGKFLLIVDGSIPTGNNGNFGTVGGKTMVELIKDVATQGIGRHLRRDLLVLRRPAGGMARIPPRPRALARLPASRPSTSPDVPPTRLISLGPL